MAIGVIGNDDKNKLLHSEENKYYDDTFKPSLDNDNESHSIICRNVDEKSIVLDVGCSQGLIGELLHNSLKCTVYGIEIDKEAIKYAEKTNSYKEIFCMDITDDKSSSMKMFIDKKLKFDYIIFSDVLEHLLDPAKVLYSFSKFLKDNGKVLISLPNIANYDIVHGLLNEKFNYSETGILDNTHLRFFTKYSFAEYVNSANKLYGINFDLRVIGKTIIKPYYYGEYPELEKLLSKNNTLIALQNIFMLEKLSSDSVTSNLNDLLNEDRINLTEKINNQLEELTRLKLENERLEKQEADLVSNNDFLYKEYTKMINSRSWKITRPLRAFTRIKNELKNKSKYKKDNKQSILFFVHSWVNVNDAEATNIGGTSLHLKDIVDAIKSDKHVYVVSVTYNRYMLFEIDGDHQNVYDLNMPVKVKNFDGYDFDFYYKIKYLIKILNIDLIHIHHVQYFPCDLHFITKEYKTILTIHDYTLLCSRLFLINCDSKYCANRNVIGCKNCNEGINYEVRNNAVEKLLSSVKQIIVPDESIINEFNKYYKFENTIVINHGIDLNSFDKISYCSKDIKNKKIKNIAMVGILDEKKGSKILKKLIKENNNRYVFHLFGMSNDLQLNKNDFNYVYHGIYEKKSLPKLLNNNEIDLVLLLSICPETFSYALSEVILSEIPVLAFDIGAIGNRVKKNKIGEVINIKSDINDIFVAIEKMLKEVNYSNYINNLKNTDIMTTKDMIKKVVTLYNDGYVPCDKDNYKSHNELKTFYLKYRL